MKKLMAGLLAGASAIVMTSAAEAQQTQSTDEASAGDGEIVVTARRRDELLQDVPLTVNAVTGQQIEDLNIERFEDLEQIVPGLNMTEATNGATVVTLRGTNFNTNVSGNNATVEFYFNDTPVQSIYVLQSMFDVGQVEVLRGPQGTLRGRASPSGSITVATRRPDLQDQEGYATVSYSDLANSSYEGALNIPIIEDHLAIRVAGRTDTDVGPNVRSLNAARPNGQGRWGESSQETDAARIQVLFEPTDNLSFSLTHQTLDAEGLTWTQVESANIRDPLAPASPILIRAQDRLALAESPGLTDQEFQITVLNAAYHFAGQGLYYVGSHDDLHLDLRGQNNDSTNFFGSTYDTATNATAFQNNFGRQDSRQSTDAHELRLQSDDPMFGFVDYVVGVLHKRDKPPTTLFDPTLNIGVLNASTPGQIPATTDPASLSFRTTGRLSETEENSYFANLNFHIGEDTELSVGGRHINYESRGAVEVAPGFLIGVRNDEWDADIYQASLKHNFTDNFMVYLSGGESWRPGNFAVGVFSTVQSPELLSAQLTPPEESTSYEIGFKSEWFNNRVRFNMSYFQQEFTNYPYRTDPVYYVNTGNPPASTVSATAFPLVAGVDLEVEGVEAELAWQITEDWNFSASAAWSNADLSGRVPCTDINGDGVQDPLGAPPSLASLQAAVGAALIDFCTVQQDGTTGAPWSASFQSEYRHQITSGIEGYLRGQLSVYDDDQRSLATTADDVDGYAILNLFAGISSPDGVWDLMIFARNVTDEQRIVYGSSVINATYVDNVGEPAPGTTSITIPTTYRTANYATPERELGVTLKYNF